MINNLIRQQILNNVARHQSIRETLGTDQVKSVILNTTVGSNKDIYGQDKEKLKAAETSKYLQCENCGRKIAGGRFAQHTNKCLDRARR
ncbi:uncharacterized protein PRCAT00005310001 [Priceomyces carsonii]|uniref:uncharacterized protein n=1 Tax=Priceomyces carsonii TaxID=28549 RepID=UPI002ED87DD8|nr:unnamed protein product [Priceomyces carsonii]